ncbi:hypothetical protein [Streptomyces cyaneofuscatus]|uniref:hypothetical protein n=1 Tax=Streptomyces cyaneofuscatus TaxID=66883 RepID=UPI0033BEDA03
MEGPGAPPGAEILGRPGVGEPFKPTVGATDTARPNGFEVTVEEVRCGEPLDPEVVAHAAESVGEPTPITRTTTANTGTARGRQGRRSA